MIDITERIREAFRSEKRDQPREYIGASGIGHACDANIAFSWRGYPETPPDERIKRIFRDGHRIEAQVVRDMRKAGLNVMESDPMTGKQWRYTGHGGHAMGSADGLIELDGEVVGVEIKSMNGDRFKSFRDHGVKVSAPGYYDQMQFLMGLSGLRRFVFIAYCKNTSDYHHEYVTFDDFRFHYLEAKVERVLSNQARRVSHDESDWRCRGCFKFDACWRGSLPPKRTVRTCGNAYGLADGTFACTICGGDTCTSWRPYQPIPKEAS